MNIIKADHDRKLQLAGMPEPVSRPVEIDQRQTGFALLRSLRIYCFSAGSVIDGHAEDDEVLMVVLAGSVELTMSEGSLAEASPRFNLVAVSDRSNDLCAAYLPPHGAYRLVVLSHAEVAYARRRPRAGVHPRPFPLKLGPIPGAASFCSRSSRIRCIFASEPCRSGPLTTVLHLP